MDLVNINKVKMIECEICFEEYQEGHLELHLKTCVLRLVFRCPICSEDYVSREGLWDHLDLHEIADENKEHHYQDSKAKYKLYQCTLCGDQRAYSESSYWMHVRNFHGSCEAQDQIQNNGLKMEYIAEETKISAPDDQVDTIGSVLDAQSSAVSTCNKRNSSLDRQISGEVNTSSEKQVVPEQTRRFRKVKGKAPKFECPHCSKKLNRLQPHVTYCGGKWQRFTCDICGQLFFDESRMERHKANIHHVDGFPKKARTKGVKCAKGRKSVKKIGTTQEMTTCGICGTTFDSADKLLQHMSTCVQPTNDQDNFQFAEIKLEATVLQNQDHQIASKSPDESFATTSRGSQSTHIKTEARTCLENKLENGITVKEEQLESEDGIETKHQVTAESSEGPIKCPICGLGFKNIHAMRYHKIVNHTEARHQCPLCQKMFYFAWHLSLHKKGCTDLRCLKCDIKFPKRVQLDRHNNFYHDRDSKSENNEDIPEAADLYWPCEICKLNFKSYTKRRYHMAVSHSEPKHKCSFCKKAFHIGTVRNRHEKMCPKMIENKEDLPEAGSKAEIDNGQEGSRRRKIPFKRNDSPVRDEAGDLVYPCNICKLNFRSYAKRRYHKTISHSEPKHKCSFCQKVFYDGTIYRRHEKGCSEMRCQECGILFTSRVLLIKHNHNVHSHDDKSKIMETTDTKTLERGINTEDNNFEDGKSAPILECQSKPLAQQKACPKEHSCSICGRTFAKVQMLWAHNISCHTEPQHQCSFCQKMFHLPKDLRRHKTWCSELRCHDCDIMFSSRVLLSKHNSFKHNRKSKVKATRKRSKS